MDAAAEYARLRGLEYALWHVQWHSIWTLFNGNGSGNFRFSYGNHQDNPGGFYFRYLVVPMAVGADPAANAESISSW